MTTWIKARKMEIVVDTQRQTLILMMTRIQAIRKKAIRSYGKVLTGNTMNINDTNYVLKQNDEENENKRGTKMVINYVDDNEIAKEENNVRNDEAPYNMANSVENMKTLLTYDKDDNITKNQVKSDKGETPPTNDTLPADIYENEGLQHVKWYKGSDETISDLKPGVNILPHYIPIVPLSSCGEGAINSIKAISDVPESIKLKEQRANDGSSKDHIDSGKTHVVGRVVINKNESVMEMV